MFLDRKEWTEEILGLCNALLSIIRKVGYKKAFFFSCFDSPSGPRPPLGVFTITLKTRHTPQDSSGQVISPSEISLLDNTQHSLETNIYASGGIRSRNTNTRVTVNPSLRTRGHWNRHKEALNCKNTTGKKSVGNAFLN
jgi:hypothetical protein